MTSNSDHPRPTPASPTLEPNDEADKPLVDQDLEDAVQWHLEHDPAFKVLETEFDISSPPPPPSALEQTLALGRQWKRKRAERTKRERDKAKALRPAPKTDAERQQAKRDRDRVQKPAPAPRFLDPDVRAQIKAEAEDRVTKLQRAVFAAPLSERRLRRMAGLEQGYVDAWEAREVLRATGASTSHQDVAYEINKRKSIEKERQAVRTMLDKVAKLEEVGIWAPFSLTAGTGGATPSGS